MAQDYGSLLIESLLKAAQAGAGPLAGASGALGALTATPVGQNPVSNMTQAFTQGMQDPMAPYRIKAAQKVLNERSMEFAKQAPDDALAGYIQMNSGQLASSPTVGAAQANNASQAQSMGMQEAPQAPQQPTSSPQTSTQPNAMSLLSKLLMAGGAGLNTYAGGDSSSLINMANQAAERQALAPGRQLQNQLAEQELLGLKPLQKGEKEKIELQGMNDFFGKIADSGTKELSETSARTLGNVDSALKQINTIEKMIGENPNVLKEWNVPGNAVGQSLATMNSDLTDILGRLRSQGSITKGEENRFKGQMVKTGFGANFEDPQTAKLKITKFKSLLTDIKKSIQPSQADFSRKVNDLIARGATKEQIYRIYKEGGI